MKQTSEHLLAVRTAKLLGNWRAELLVWWKNIGPQVRKTSTAMGGQTGVYTYRFAKFRFVADIALCAFVLVLREKR